MAFSYRAIDGGLHIVDACPADIGPTMVWPVEVPDGRTILVAQRQDEVRRFDARTGEAVGDPGRWPGWAFDFGCAAAAVPDGRPIVVGTGDRGISRYDLLSGEAYPPTAGEKACTIWAVTTATLPGGRVMVADAGYDGRDRGRPALGRGDRRPARGTTGASADGTPRRASRSASRSRATAPSSRRSPRLFRPTERRCSSPGAR